MKPSLILQREKPAPLPQVTAEQPHQINRLKEVEAAARELYWQHIDKKPLADIQAEITELIESATDIFEKPTLWTSKSSLLAHKAGIDMRYHISFPKNRPVDNSPKDGRRLEERNSRRARESDRASLQDGLRGGASLVFSSDGRRLTLIDPPQAHVIQIMTEQGLSREQRVERLKEEVFGDYDAALDIVDNYDEAEWTVK